MKGMKLGRVMKDEDPIRRYAPFRVKIEDIGGRPPEVLRCHLE
ncbi:hypothetical protein [Thermococcus pacificus]|nr:hypothetical protein [Thermococcus pacificus]